MPFERGSFSMTIFKLSEELPEDILERFNSHAAGKLDDVKDKPQIGWVSGRHLLERNIDDETAILGGHISLSLRIAQRKIPTSLLKAEAKMEELAYIKATGNPDIPKKIKKEIKQSIEEKRLPQMIPSISGVPFIIDRTDNTLYLGTTSLKQIDTFLGLFHDTLKMSPIQMSSEELMVNCKFNPTAYKGFCIAKSGDEEHLPGRDFLTWLWYFSEEDNGTINVKNHGDFAVMIDGPLSFVADGQGALESVVKKGNPLRSAEARAALNVGKKLKKAKIIFAKDNENWAFTLDVDSFTFSSVVLPEGEEMDYGSRFAERVVNMNILKDVFKACFSTFISEVSSEIWQNKIKKMQKWAENRESL